MIDVLLDTLIDGLKLLPFLFVTYIVMEYLEHKTSEKSKKIVKKAGKFGPLVGGLVGVFPQCGFSAAAANLYAGRVITLGTLIAIFLSTSDEMLPVLISESAPITLILQVLLIKLVIGIISGVIIDLIVSIYRKKKNIEPVEDEKIEDICEHEHCHCEEEKGIIKPALKHTVNIFVFIIIISLVINIVIHYIGEENISNLVSGIPVLSSMIAGIIGFIPNCAGSVVLTQLFMENVISLGTMVAGLLVGSGIGILVLFRVNKNIKQNLKIAGILYMIGVISGILIDLVM